MSSIHVSPDCPKEILCWVENIDSELQQRQIQVTITIDTVTLLDQNQQLPPLTLSFTSPKHTQYIQNPQHQPLIKAMHCKQANPEDYIIDLTAGFGKDSLLLSTLRQPLISIEKNRITATILQILVCQYQLKNPHCQWQVICSCAVDWLTQSHTICATHLYLDPFFAKKTSALPKKDMQWLHHLNQSNTPHHEESLFLLACQKTADRVIVKRDKKADFINQKKPNQGSIMQKTSRFDCYKFTSRT